MPACARPVLLSATPLGRPRSEKVPSWLLWNRKLGTESLATNRSGQPSSSRSENSTPKEKAPGCLTRAASVTSVKVPSPLLR